MYKVLLMKIICWWDREIVDIFWQMGRYVASESIGLRRAFIGKFYG